jgi:hypothetical protein
VEIGLVGIDEFSIGLDLEKILLAIATDFRDVISAVLERHLDLNEAKLNQILPNYIPTQKLTFI